MTIEGYFKGYLKDKPFISDTEKQKLQNAFYAGFTEFFHLVMNDCENFNDAEYCKILNGFSTELLTFWSNEKDRDQRSKDQASTVFG